MVGVGRLIGPFVTGFILTLSFAIPFFRGHASVFLFISSLVAWTIVVVAYISYGLLRVNNPGVTDNQPFIEEAYRFAREVFSTPNVWYFGGLTGALYMMIVLGYGGLETWWSQHTMPWWEKGPDAIAAFLAGLSTFLVINTFYRTLAPYTDMWELLEQLRKDLSEALDARGRVEIIWIYPGLGLGRYRSFDHAGNAISPFGDEYNAFSAKLTRAFDDKNIRVRAVVYPDHILKAFYCSYYFQTLADSAGSTGFPIKESLLLQPSKGVTRENIDWSRIITAPIIENCLKEEQRLANRGALEESNQIFQVKSPDYMPMSVIVINDVVYQLASFGFPIFHPDNEAVSPPFKELSGFFHPNPRDRLIRLVAYRTKDRLLSNIVSAHLDHFVDLATKQELIQKRAAGEIARCDTSSAVADGSLGKEEG